MTSEWAQWRLKSPALRLFSQPFIHLQSKEYTKAQRHWHLRGDFTGDRWIPRTKGRWRGKCFHWMTSSWDDKFPKLHRHSKFWRHRIDMLIKLHPNALTKPLFYKYKFEGLYIIYLCNRVAFLIPHLFFSRQMMSVPGRYPTQTPTSSFCAFPSTIGNHSRTFQNVGSRSCAVTAHKLPLSSSAANVVNITMSHAVNCYLAPPGASFTDMDQLYS